jgi:hypothetical protein
MRTILDPEAQAALRSELHPDQSLYSPWSLEYSRVLWAAFDALPLDRKRSLLREKKKPSIPPPPPYEFTSLTLLNREPPKPSEPPAAPEPVEVPVPHDDPPLEGPYAELLAKFEEPLARGNPQLEKWEIRQGLNAMAQQIPQWQSTIAGYPEPQLQIARELEARGRSFFQGSPS